MGSVDPPASGSDSSPASEAPVEPEAVTPLEAPPASSSAPTVALAEGAGQHRRPRSRRKTRRASGSAPSSTSAKPRASSGARRRRRKAARTYLSRELAAEIRAAHGRGEEAALTCARLSCPPRFIGQALAEAGGHELPVLTRSLADKIRAACEKGDEPAAVAARFGVPLELVERALSSGLAGPAENVEPLPDPEPEQLLEELEPEAEPLNPKELVAFAEAVLETVTRLGVTILRAPLEPAQVDALAALSKGERRALEILAPHAAPHVPAQLSRFGPLLGIAFGALVLALFAQRAGAVRRSSPRRKHVRSAAVRRDEWDGEDDARARGSQENGTAPRGDGLRSFAGGRTDPFETPL